MKFKRIALFAVAWFLLQSALMMGAFYVLFKYQGEELVADPAAGAATVARYVSLMEAVATVGAFLVYLLFLRALQSRLVLHALALFASLELLQILFATAVNYTASSVTGEHSPVNLSDWLPVWARDLAIALLAVAVVSLFRQYKSRKALAEPPPADRT